MIGSKRPILEAMVLGWAELPIAHCAKTPGWATSQVHLGWEGPLVPCSPEIPIIPHFKPEVGWK